MQEYLQVDADDVQSADLGRLHSQGKFHGIFLADSYGFLDIYQGEQNLLRVLLLCSTMLLTSFQLAAVRRFGDLSELS